MNGLTPHISSGGPVRILRGQPLITDKWKQHEAIPITTERTVKSPLHVTCHVNLSHSLNRNTQSCCVFSSTVNDWLLAVSALVTNTSWLLGLGELLSSIGPSIP